MTVTVIVMILVQVIGISKITILVLVLAIVTVETLPFPRHLFISRTILVIPIPPDPASKLEHGDGACHSGHLSHKALRLQTALKPGVEVPSSVDKVPVRTPLWQLVLMTRTMTFVVPCSERPSFLMLPNPKCQVPKAFTRLTYLGYIGLYLPQGCYHISHPARLQHVLRTRA